MKTTWQADRQTDRQIGKRPTKPNQNRGSCIAPAACHSAKCEVAHRPRSRQADTTCLQDDIQAHNWMAGQGESGQQKQKHKIQAKRQFVFAGLNNSVNILTIGSVDWILGGLRLGHRGIRFVGTFASLQHTTHLCKRIGTEVLQIHLAIIHKVPDAVENGPPHEKNNKQSSKQRSNIGIPACA